MVLRIDKAFGVSIGTLMRMQNSYDIARAEDGEEDQSECICAEG
jgi:plasmid maintenance system antidote protein VapI